MNPKLSSLPSPLQFRPAMLQPPSFLSRNLQIRKRRLLKVLRRREACRPVVAMSFSLDGLLQGLVSAFPNVNSLDLVVPALGFASGAALYLASNRSHRRGRHGEGLEVAGDWVLFSSPTPFNRSVLLRCPSLSLEDGGEALDSVNVRLLERDRQFVGMNRNGRIPAHSQDPGTGDGIEYQRVCVPTGDGGVISIDWPENLDLEKEQGLDTTVVLVPGTTDGSMDRDVRDFVHAALNYGFFPIVMNPRGCAGSPLTTPRLFTSADSDDVCTAIQFIKGARPWTTLMSVGWGYGANMLTKYLSELGEQTPLTAAVCLNNPFDLEEVTMSYPYHVALDQKFTSGLKDILQANKEIFQGKTKGFDVARALAAISVREFDRAISMISYGFESLQEFYSWSSTRQLVHHVKIPLLFMQNDDSSVPHFSIPRGLITENPFTSLLVCSSPLNINSTKRSAISCCQHLAIEWLQAAELALLKGRHPLLKDVDIPLNPSKHFSLVGSRTLEKSLSSGSAITRKYTSASSKSTDGKHLEFTSSADAHIIEDEMNSHHEVMQTEEANSVDESQSTVPSISNNIEDNSLDGGSSQMLATAEVVLNMLDRTMPSSLSNEQKKKVLTAMEQGETLMNALEGAVPEDVRGKLTSAVSEVLQTQSRNVNFDRLMNLSLKKSMIQERMKGNSTAGDSVLYQRNNDGNEKRDDSSHLPYDRSISGSSTPANENLSQNSETLEHGQEMEDKRGEVDITQKKVADIHEQEKVDQHQRLVDDKHNNRRTVTGEEENLNVNGAEREDPASGEGMPVLSTDHEKSSSSSTVMQTSEGLNASEKENQNNQDKAGQNVESSSINAESSSSLSSSAPPINVSEALDAFKSFDDSTQMAVNSVFGVIENMIDQLEKKTDKSDSNDDNSGNIENDENCSRSDEVNKNEEQKDDLSNGPPSDDLKANEESLINGYKSEKIESDNCGFNLESSFIRSSDQVENKSGGYATSHQDLKNTSSEENPNFNYSSAIKNSLNISSGNHMKIYYPNMDKSADKVQGYPLTLNKDSYWESAYKAYLKNYFLSHMPTMKSYDSQSATDLVLDPEKGQWKILDQVQNGQHSKQKVTEHHNNNDNGQNMQRTIQKIDKEKVIETSYVVLNNEQSKSDKRPTEELKPIADGYKQDGLFNVGTQKLTWLVKTTILDSLKVEVQRKLGIADIDDIEPNLASDLENIADAVSHELLQVDDLTLSLKDDSPTGMKFGTIRGKLAVDIISSAVQDAVHLKKLLPIGVIVGSTLACLGKYFNIDAASDGKQDETIPGDDMIDHQPDGGRFYQVNEELDNVHSCDGDVMVGAATAVLGASALLAHCQVIGEQNKAEKTDDTNNVVRSLTEKAVSVAGPIVPTKSDGEINQERLLSLFTELGQKGGLLRFFGNIALLWGGIRGAMSLTDRLIRFLRIAERPFLHRILGFACMVLVIWSPVAIPLFPHIVLSWTSKSSIGIAGYACLVGLHVSVWILIMLWGKRIRGYEFPLEQYGLNFRSASQVYDSIKGFIGGILLVLGVHSTNVLLGYACFVRPSAFPPSSAGAAMLFKAYGKLVLLSIRGIATASSVAIVEELLFRSWLPDEIAADLGYHRAIIISGLAFAFFQRSLSSVPGFLFFSLALFGAKQRFQGSLSIPIGARVGIMVACFVLQTAGFVAYNPGTPFWLVIAHPWHPFDGAVGLIYSIVLAIFLYPWQYLPEKKAPMEAQE